MRKFFSLTAFIVSCTTMLFGASRPEIVAAVEATENPELIKFLAPIVASLLTKAMEYLFKWSLKRKQKESEVTDEL